MGSALLTDLYQLAMGAVYVHSGLSENRATFELFIRRLPPRVRSYLVVAGLAPVLEYLAELKFTPDEVGFVRHHPQFQQVGSAFFDRLSELRFTGNVWAIAEGTIAFAEEPLLRIEAPLIEAQLVETYVLSMINFQTSVATKAARIVEAGRGRPVVEFGTRRAHTPYAGLYGARAAYIGGCVGSSNVEAGYAFGIPTYGTFAHSLAMAFDSEEEAFGAFTEVFRDHATLLIDTWDALRGTETAARMAQPVAAVRIDSGDFLELTREMRKILDRGGKRKTRIMASGDLNEYRIEDLTRLGAPIDSYGVGTELITSIDAPALSGVYKLVEIERGGRTRYTAKFSEEKITYPGSKQVFRFADRRSGVFRHDLIACAGETPKPETATSLVPLLVEAMKQGRLTQPAEKLEHLQARCREQLGHLPRQFRQLVDAPAYRVRYSENLRALLRVARRKGAANQPPASVPHADRGGS